MASKPRLVLVSAEDPNNLVYKSGSHKRLFAAARMRFVIEIGIESFSLAQLSKWLGRGVQSVCYACHWKWGFYVSIVDLGKALRGNRRAICGDRRIYSSGLKVRCHRPASLQVASQDVAAIDPPPLPQERMNSPY